MAGRGGPKPKPNLAPIYPFPPQSPEPNIPPPARLDPKVRAVWEELSTIPSLAGLITPTYSTAFELLCDRLALYRAACSAIDMDDLTDDKGKPDPSITISTQILPHILTLLRLFGLTPDAAKIHATDSEELLD